ncbi:MAG: methylated-DNA--[protein]-cysteine S-methyltransferase [Deltaproteobacteria bacterium]|nr:methylated-DNA--[protein]-cysteine S-methyltransferase [Deltaproteobacteria bacterium]
MTTWYAELESPLGTMVAVKRPAGLAALRFVGQKHDRPVEAGWERAPERFVAEREQLAAYFAGERATFDLGPLAPEGTAFQRRVWEALRAIPPGETRAYGELARALGLPAGAARAVGAANGRNPLSIIVPCHRVVGADGALTGYAGGLARKRWLLDHERGATPTT